MLRMEGGCEGSREEARDGGRMRGMEEGLGVKGREDDNSAGEMEGGIRST